MPIILVLILLMAILVTIVAVQNATPVALTLLIVEVSSISLSLLILTSMAIGAVLMLILSAGGWVRNRRTLGQRDKTIARLEAELAGERARPVSPAEPRAPTAGEPPNSPAGSEIG
jgi:uncharacterized integral membrane protein